MEKGVIVFIRASGIYYDSRASKEIKSLVEGGYRVEVIGWDRTGMALEKCQKVFSEIIDYVNFHFFDLQISHLGIKNMDKLLKWMKYIKTEFTSIYNANNIFAIHACDFDTGFAITKFVKKNKIHFIYDIYDYYCDSHNMPEPLRIIVSRLENAIINISDATIICTKERKEQIRKAHPSKVIVIYNSPDINEGADDVEKEFDYVYCGTLAGGRLLKEILENYKYHTDIKMVFGGDGEFAELCRELDQRYEHFSYVGVIPYSKVLELEKKSKVISAIYDPSIRNHRLCAPNKFYEALAIGIPIIVCRGTGIDSIVEEQSIGHVIDYSVKDFYQSLDNMIKDDEMYKQISKKSREIYKTQYRWKSMKDKLISLYTGL